MVSPLSLSPSETPASFYLVSFALAFYVFPALFVLVSVWMLVARVRRPPYFAYFCASGALGTLSFGFSLGNTPVSALAFFIAFLACPPLMVRNLFVLRSLPKPSIFHAGARWASVSSLAILGLLLLWTLFDSWRLPPAAARARGNA